MERRDETKLNDETINIYFNIINRYLSQITDQKKIAYICKI